ncbi:hypothetical protein DFR29_105262 [Tahibacter aquaticus]|uniref:Ribonuclease VapC n=1 Tax=Tahibacter aquaticus TaxID=520092 RepID=A0A4R6Z117_9GAMM|nr:PIN domain-containing protein [Tahibacter aquaticus]TDR45079.1 hypothetical protein DFR29_105262 [Tahibacter aquaticus]
MRYLLDTNILSHAIKPQPSPDLLTWLSNQHDDDLYIAALTLAEIRRGILNLPAGRKRSQLEHWFAGAEGPPALFAGRILAFDERAALLWAELMHEGKRSGRPRDALDMMVAAVAGVRGCIIVTDNERDFAGLEIYNPLKRHWLQDSD